MTHLLGLVGKPNCGKSTFYSAATLAPAEIANYPFTTIKPNRGVAFVRVKCPCQEFNTTCSPRVGKCIDGVRFAPIELLDVAGLVPGAHQGKGLGNQFLDDLRQAAALIHVVDSSGGTDAEGKPCELGEHNPDEDVAFLEHEISAWFIALLQKDWDTFTRKLKADKPEVLKALAERFSGLGVVEEEISAAIRASELNLDSFGSWSPDDLKRLATELRKRSKPILICANKSDLPGAKKLEDSIQTSADSELALRRAAEKSLIAYEPGDPNFEDGTELTDDQKNGLNLIRENVLKKYGNTGVQQALDQAVFKLLGMIPVYPVEDEGKYTDKNGNVLPDIHLVPKGTTAKELAYRIHTDIGKNFMGAVDARSKQRKGAEYELQSGDVVKILVSK